MHYKLIDSAELSGKYPEVDEMDCIFVDLENGLDGKYYILKKPDKNDYLAKIKKHEAEN